MIFFNAASVLSWAMSRLKGDFFCADDPEEQLRASLQPGGKKHKYIAEGGAWRRHRDHWIARRDGDTAALERLDAEQEQCMAEMAVRWQGVFGKGGAKTEAAP
jgi:hypothetical protein